MEKNIIGKEYKFAFHLPKIDGLRDDTHVIKENIHYANGCIEPNLKIVKNYNRPIWFTKPIFRNHKSKKEFEEEDRLNKIMTTESDIVVNLVSRLGDYRFDNRSTLRDVRDSQYVYGLDVNSLAFIKNVYRTKYPEISSPYKIAGLDIETNINTDEIIIVGIGMKDKFYATINKRMLHNTLNTKTDLEYLWKKYLPDETMRDSITPEFEVVENELEAVLKALEKLHTWDMDIVAVWNISFDIEKILNVLEKNNVNPKDVFSSPALPKELRDFKYKKGKEVKITASGVRKSLDPQEKWITIFAPASFYWLDAMSVYNYVRVGGKQIPGGYSLDNVLSKELGDKLKKLKFQDDLVGVLPNTIDWHRYMVSDKPLQYIIYNAWDILSMIKLDEKTKDMSVSMPLLCGISDFSIFDSQPKRLVNEMFFFYLEKGKIMGTKPNLPEERKNLGLSNWIVTLPIYRINNDGTDVIKEGNIINNIRTHVMDADQTSGYPSDTRVANVSKSTTVRELLSVGDMDKEDFKINNLNLMYGKVNYVDYCNKMFNFPKLQELI